MYFAHLDLNEFVYCYILMRVTVLRDDHLAMRPTDMNALFTTMTLVSQVDYVVT